MSAHLNAAWTGLTNSPLFGITLTLLAYQAARTLWKRSNRHSLANPVLISLVIVVSTLLATHISETQYMIGGQYIGFLLGPATVALAVPLYNQAARIKQGAPLVLVCVTIGSTTAAAAGITATKLAGGTDALAISMAPKSATTPVAIAISQSAGGIAALTAVFTILTGVLGAVAGPRLLTLLRIRDERIRGLSIGVVSHGIGTARLLTEDPTAGAFSALAMAINALVTAIAVPLLLATPLLTI